MESNEHPPLYFSKSVDTDPSSARKEPAQSPYLKAILSGTIQNTGRVVRMAISDRLAAIRYIQESQWRDSLSRS